MLNLLFELANRVGLLIMLAFVFSKTSVFKNILIRRKKLSFKEKLIMALFYGGLGILGSLSGIEFRGAIVNTRVIGVVIGGLLGGPTVGVLSGVIAGLHRYLIDPGGMTSFACTVSTIIEGLLAGYLSDRFQRSSKPVLFAWVTGSAAEIMQMVVIIVLARPYAYSSNLVSIIGVPMIVMNGIGIALFVAIIENIKQLQLSEAAFRAEQTLQIADKTTQYFKQGLNSNAAQQITEIIMEMTDFQAAAITDGTTVLAHTGMGKDHSRVGQEIETDMTRHVLLSGEPLINQNAEEMAILYTNYDLKCAIIVPLKLKAETIGTLKLYKDKENSISKVDEELAIGMAKLFSTQLELSQIEEKEALRAKAELDALQAQINPHFLFNAINTIVSLIRTEPDEARELLIHLGDYFRNNMQFNKEMIPISDELKNIEAYLKIEKARFGAKLLIDYDISETLDALIPPHGIFPKETQGEVKIKIYQDETLHLIVEDDGVGMSDDKKKDAIGLQNVKKRLHSIYGKNFKFDIESAKDKGTKVSIEIGGSHD
jgi:two-component system sensor histidine kinase LytS